MSDAEALKDYTEFDVPSDIAGSATEIYPAVLDSDPDEASTAPHVARRALEQQRRSFRGAQAAAESVSSFPGTVITIFGENGEPSFSFFDSRGVFAVLDEMRTPQGQIRRQIRNLLFHSPLTYHERLARRLEFLLEAMEEEGEEWAERSPDSLREMLLFLQSVSSYRYPTVTVTPSATFRAQWTADRNAHFALDFLADGQVRFVVFCPDPRHPDRIKRLSGITSWNSVRNDLEPFKVHRWTVDAGA